MRFYKVCFVLLFLLAISSQSAFADTWAKTYGGGNFDAPPGGQVTSDGGFILAGFTSSFGAADNDFWVLKLYPDGPMAEELGVVEWAKRYELLGGNDLGFAIQETSEGEFFVVGMTMSFDTFYTDFLVLKLNDDGTLAWQKTYGGSGTNKPGDFNCAQATQDGGVIVVGATNSFGAGSNDVWVLKLDADGNVGTTLNPIPGTWQKTYGRADYSEGGSAIQGTSDGGFIVVGSAMSLDTFNPDLLVLKLNANGDVVWQKTYGGSGTDRGIAVQQTFDMMGYPTGYIVAGETDSFGAGGSDFWVLRLDDSGDVIWQKTYGGDYDDWPSLVQETSDEGFLVSGIIDFFAVVNEDGLVLKLNANGDVVWQKTYGGSGGEATSAKEIIRWEDPTMPPKENLIIWGRTDSYGAGDGDFWVLKTTVNGEIPDCSAIGEISVNVSDTFVVGQNADVTINTSNAEPGDPDISTWNTEAQTSVVCGGGPPDPCADDGGDTDGDGVCGDFDNCPSVANAGQEDGDLDGVGDVCDTCTDTDGDGYGNPGYPANTCPQDNCPNNPNKIEPGVCGCGTPDTDSDTDGTPDCNDNCPTAENPDQSDIDNDTNGDVCDICPNDDTDTCVTDKSAGGSFDSDGGTLTTPDGSVSITIPPGELSSATSISITGIDEEYELIIDEAEGTALYGVIIEPEGLTVIEEPITISFSWSDSDDDGIIDGTSVPETSLIITKDGTAITGTCGEEIEIGCDTATNTFSIEVTSLSVFTLMVLNGPPIVENIISLDDPLEIPREVPTQINVIASFTDTGFVDIHPSAIWDWGDDTISVGVVNETGGSGTVEGSHLYESSGVYTVTLTVTDDNDESGTSMFQYVVVYDPDGGFVTGGGWIDSPEGAYTADTTLTGKANFGFVSKYKKGATVPTGNTEFQFKVADLNFHSDTYDWLVIAGAKAMYKGIGTINGEGEYKFILTAIDADINENDSHVIDRFRIKIWTEDEFGNEDVVYDNALGDDSDEATTEIGGGSIVIHKK